MHSQKYPRTYHFPFSPGTTSDDRIAKSFDRLLTEPIVITEKLDGENTCLNQYGVFARSHAAPTRNPWANYLRDHWNGLHKQLGELELFGESLYAVHSIKYTRLESYFYLFGIREGDRWLAWDEVEFYAGVLGLPTVPVLFWGSAGDLPATGGCSGPCQPWVRYYGVSGMRIQMGSQKSRTNRRTLDAQLETGQTAL
jgi:hypothetical protein